MKYLVSLAVLIPYTIYAQDSLTAPIQPPDINYNPGLAGIIFKLILSLVIIIGLIYATVFILKKLGHRSLPGSSGMIEVISKSYLAPKQSLYIVKLGTSYSVLGVGESSINLIKELSPDEVESFKKPSQDVKGFQNIFKSVLGK